MSESKKIALVTGASSGLGAEFCRQLARDCDVIIGVARRLETLQLLADSLAEQVEFHPVKADLTTVEGVTQTMEILRQKGPVEVLVNNAGFIDYAEFADAAIGRQRDMLTLHCDTSITLCRAALPFMRERGKGSIINVSSLAAFFPGKMLPVYGASKVFLNLFSQSLQEELEGSGIEVQALCPGYTRSEFHAPMAELGFDENSIPEQMWMSAEQVVSDSLAALGSGKVIVIPGEENRALARQGLEQLLHSI